LQHLAGLRPVLALGVVLGGVEEELEVVGVVLGQRQASQVMDFLLLVGLLVARSDRWEVLLESLGADLQQGHSRQQADCRQHEDGST